MDKLPIDDKLYFLVGMYEPPTADDWLVIAASKQDAIDKVVSFLNGKHANGNTSYSPDDFIAEQLELLQ